RRLAGEALAIQTVLLDVLDAGFHLALALGVIALAGVDPVAGGGGVVMEALVQGQLAIALIDHHQLGLIVDALLSDATKIAESLVVQLDEGLGIKGPE